jgi:Dynein heavy chain AAA lid domain
MTLRPPSYISSLAVIHPIPVFPICPIPSPHLTSLIPVLILSIPTLAHLTSPQLYPGMVDGEMGQKLKQAVPVTNIDMMKQLCCVIDAHLPLDIIDPVDIEYLYIFSVIWSLGAALTGSARVKIDGNYSLFIKKPFRLLS